MNLKTNSVRTFIGASDYESSRRFYRSIGFNEIKISEAMCSFQIDDKLSFYLQDYFVEDWVNNCMIFLEVDNVEDWYEKLNTMELPKQFPGVRLKEIVHADWGKEFFLHDPSGVLWHIGTFND